MKLCDNPQCKWHRVSIPNRRGGVTYLPTEVGGGSVRRTRVGMHGSASAVKVAMKTPVAWRYRRVGGEVWTLSHPSPMTCGHSPVDSGARASEELYGQAVEALAKITEEQPE